MGKWHICNEVNYIWHEQGQYAELEYNGKIIDYDLLVRSLYSDFVEWLEIELAESELQTIEEHSSEYNFMWGKYCMENQGMIMFFVEALYDSVCGIEYIPQKYVKEINSLP